jgi:hypothetical protein
MGKATLTLTLYPLKGSREPCGYLFVSNPLVVRPPEEGQDSAYADFLRDKGMGGFVT